MAPKKRVFGQTEVVTLPVEDVKQLISEAVYAGMVDCQPHCPIPEEHKKEIGRVFGMVKDVGGVDTIRHNHEFTYSFRGLVAATAKKAYYTVITSLILFAITAFAVGFHFWAGK